MPYQPPKLFYERFVNQEHDRQQISRLTKISGLWDHLAGKLILTEKDLQILGELYDGEIAFADHCVGQIIKHLKKLGIADDTLVIVTSDLQL